MMDAEVSEDGKTLTIRWDLELYEGRMAPTITLRPEMLEKAGFVVGESELKGLSGELKLTR